MFLLALLSLFISGCVFNQEGQEQVKEQPTRPINVKNSVIENVDRKTGQEISEHLVELASQVPEVNDATAVVIGPYAIVGIDVKEELNRTEVGSVKYSVAESLKHDPNGKNALIVADPDITARLRHIAIDIDKGEPIEGILNDFGDIVAR